MPLGKYYCDYCDKQFQDTPSSRRRHLQGVAHQRAKALWYDAVRSSSQLGLDQVQEGVCNRFVRTGSCQFGDLCKYYHPKKNAPNMNTQGIEGTSSVNNVPSWGISALVFGNQMGASLGNLPPSLWPPPEGSEIFLRQIRSLSLQFLPYQFQFQPMPVLQLRNMGSFRLPKRVDRMLKVTFVPSSP